MDIRGVLITGAGGFLGSHLAEYFLKKNLPVIGVDNFVTGQKENIQYLQSLPGGRNFLFFTEDVTKPWEKWADTIPIEIRKKITHVLHFASPASPPHYQRLGLETMWVNSLGLSHALNWADKLSARVVFASTSEVYGDPDIHPQPETYRGSVNTCGIRSCYDEGKRFGESLIHTHNLKMKTRHGVVRIFNTYGPRMNPDDGRVIINFLVQAHKGELLTIYGDGRQTRSFCYVDDLISGIIAYSERDLVEPVNLGSDVEFSILELAGQVRKLFQGKELSITHSELPQDDPKVRCPDLTLAKKLLHPWQPRVPLEEGLKRMWQWIRSDRKV